jgi:hypothetical protein
MTTLTRGDDTPLRLSRDTERDKKSWVGAKIAYLRLAFCNQAQTDQKAVHIHGPDGRMAENQVKTRG